MSSFSHLHVHTEYSILDGLAKIPDLIRKAYDDGQRAMAITDHGNMFGVFSFVEQVEKFNAKHAKKNDPFKAIIGCEVYVAANSRFDKDKTVRENRSGKHLILLAKNWTGYRNLSRIVSYSYSEGMYYTPRVDKELLRKYSEGIIASSACLGGEVPQAILKYNNYDPANPIPTIFNLDEASKIIEEYKSIFGNDYYLELQNNGHREQIMVNEALKQLSVKHQVRCIATNDVHFVNREDFEAHRMLICINTRRDFYSKEGSLQDEDSDNGLAYSGEEYLKTTAEMVELFKDFPEAIANTNQLVNKIESYRLASEPLLPKFEVPKEFKNEYDYLEHLTYQGAKRRWKEIDEKIQERLTFELETIKKMGFAGYFLIVQDFINAGKKQGIRFGPGRGSAAGSAISYCLGITNFDPIKYNLLFERFLNPDRISMPDMDIDIEDTGRDAVIEYVTQKYGFENVAQIITFNTMAAKSAIRDCARVLQLNLNESNRLAKLVPETPKITFDKVFETTPELKKELKSPNELIRKTLQYAMQLEGTVRSSGVHACGVIIGKNNLYDSLPLCTAKNSDVLVTQYEGKQVEDAGLLKMDFLGLKTLNIISNTLYNIKKRQNIDVDIDNIPFDDKKTYELFSMGDTTAIFQFESPGMRKYLQELKPERFDDVYAMVALYRPGPMDNIPHFINRKFGREKISYPIEGMGTFLDETYGITVYQEQVMQLAQFIANFTPSQADTMRKAMGKKNELLMNELEEAFYQGGMKNGHPKKTLEEIWKEWKRFSSYAFNKSHATCYAYVAYQTAYLKAHYPAEFMAANLTNNLKDLSKITSLIDDTLRMGINILGPDVNESELDFIVNKKGDIRFGLGGLKNMGASTVVSLVEEREKNGNYENIFDFIKRQNFRLFNKRSLEALAYAGAFDCFDNIHRAQFFHEDNDGKSFIEKLINYGNGEQTNISRNQTSIFDFASDDDEDFGLPEIPACEPWHPLEQLKFEKEIAGFYISGHPLDEYKTIIDNFTNVNLETIANPALHAQYAFKTLSFVAIVTAVKVGITKNNKDYGTIQLEDYNGNYNWTLFGEEFTRYKHLFEEGKQLFIKARLEERYYNKNKDTQKNYDLKPISIFYLSDSYDNLCKNITLTFNVKDIAANIAYLIKEAAETYPGKVPLYIRVATLAGNFHSDLHSYDLKVEPEKFVKQLKLTIPHQITFNS